MLLFFLDFAGAEWCRCKNSDLVEYVGGYFGEAFVRMAAACSCAALEPSLCQQNVVKHVLGFLQLFRDVHIVMHAEHLRALNGRQVLRSVSIINRSINLSISQSVAIGVNRLVSILKAVTSGVFWVVKLPSPEITCKK